MKRHSQILYLTLALCAAPVTNAQIPNINTVAGGLPQNRPATQVAVKIFAEHTGIAFDAAGNTYFASGRSIVYKVNSKGLLTTFAGEYNVGPRGDGGQATQASFRRINGLAVDVPGNIYLADALDHRIRIVDPNGIVNTFAGVTQGYGGDNGQAVNALLSFPQDVAVDAAGNVLIADTDNHRIRKVDLNGVITTIAGGNQGFAGDNGPATNARLSFPAALALDPAGQIYIVDGGNQRIRKIDANGIITTFAGNGQEGFAGDGGPAFAASLDFGPVQRGTQVYGGVAVDAAGAVYIADTFNNRIRVVDLNGVIKNFAGDGIGRLRGDGGPPGAAEIGSPTGVAVGPGPTIFIADADNNRIRDVVIFGFGPGNIETFAGSYRGECDPRDVGLSGDGGPATNASVCPGDLSVDAAGNLYISEPEMSRIRKVDAKGIITNFAGTPAHPCGFAGDGGPAVAAIFCWVGPTAPDAAGNLYIVDIYNQRIRKVDVNGVISTFAGDGNPGPAGLNGPAVAASISPTSVATDAAGNVYILDSIQHGMWKVDPAGIISVVAVNTFQFGQSMSSDGAQEFVVDWPVVKKLDGAGIVSTFAGNGNMGFCGDGGPAINACMDAGWSVADNGGNVYIWDLAHDRSLIRRVDPKGIINTFVGNGTIGFAGDGGPVADASITEALWGHNGLAVDAKGNLYLADHTLNPRVRFVSPFNLPPSLTHQTSGTPGNGGWYISDVTAAWVLSALGSRITSTSGCDPTLLNADTAGVTFSCTASTPGGTTTDSVTIKRDATPPTITISSPGSQIIRPPSDGSSPPPTVSYLLNQPVTASYSCADDLSGVATCSGPVPTGVAVRTSAVGAQQFTVTATDAAGNGASKTNSYNIVYASGGLVNGEPGHQILAPIKSDGTSVFKQGRTVPAKFRIADANGVSIGTPGVISSFAITEIISGTVTTVVDNTVPSTTPDAAFRWDSQAQQWIFNISTQWLSPNTTYVFTITLNDGSTINFQFGLK